MNQYTRYHCTQPHVWGNSGTYHYSDEEIYQKHLEPDSKVETLEAGMIVEPKVEA